MTQLRKLGLATVLTALACLAAFGCKKETVQAPGATQQELNREGWQTAHDHKKNFDDTLGMPVMTPEELQSQRAQKANEPAVSLGTGGGPKDEVAPAKKTAAPPRRVAKE